MRAYALFVGLLATLSQSVVSQSAREHREQAQLFYNKKQYEDCAEAFLKTARLDSADFNSYYGAACCKALAGDHETAFLCLDTAIERGWRDTTWMYADNDLVSLRASEGWRARIEKIRQYLRNEEMQANKPYREALLRIGDDDQRYRRMIDSVSRTFGWQSSQMGDLGRQIQSVDSVNLQELEKLITQFGWPTRTMVGKRSCMAAWLVIQHSELPVQEKYLPMIEKAARDGDLDKSSYALLVDRVRMRKGQRQLYGSQIIRDSSGVALYPIEDEENVNRRRLEMGMQPIEEYVKRWNIFYVRPSSGKE